MEIHSLKLLNFRNYNNITLNFSKKLNLIVGNNGSGKTNIIEAINILALTKTFRNVFDTVLIKQNEEKSIIEGKIKSKIINNFKIEITKNGKKAQINKNKIIKLSDYISKILIVTFSSNDLKMIKDSPNIRRKLLNIEISQLNNNYLKYLNEYNKIIKQRNAYLKTLYINKTHSTDFLNILTDRLIYYGLLICDERNKFINLINENIGIIFSKINKNNDNLKIIYNSDYLDQTQEKLLIKYNKSIERDIMLGKTNIGIHTDDIIFQLNNNNMRDYSSEGQQKNAIISLKLSEIEIIKKLKKENPILLIDDLYSELDKNKIKNILELLDPNLQTIITVTDLNKVSKKIRENAKIFYIKDGEVIEK